MIYSADGLWERLKKRSRRLALSDTVADHTHIGHAFVTVLLGGAIGVVLMTLASLAIPFLPDWPLHFKLGVGCAVANVCYLIREIEARWRDWDYSLWDGVLDVYVPALLWVPAATGSLAVGYVMTAGYAVLFYCFRPLK